MSAPTLPDAPCTVDLRYAKYEDDRPCWRVLLSPPGVEVFAREVRWLVPATTFVEGVGGARRGSIVARGRVRWHDPERLVLVVEVP